MRKTNLLLLLCPVISTQRCLCCSPKKFQVVWLLLCRRTVSPLISKVPDNINLKLKTQVLMHPELSMAKYTLSPMVSLPCFSKIPMIKLWSDFFCILKLTFHREDGYKTPVPVEIKHLSLVQRFTWSLSHIVIYNTPFFLPHCLSCLEYWKQKVDLKRQKYDAMIIA